MTLPTVVGLALCCFVMASGLALMAPSYAQIQETQGQKIKRAESKLREKSFLDLFIERQKIGDGAGVLTGQATQYITSCCKERDVAVKLLRDNGFKIYSKTYGPNETYPSGFQNEEHYDETILGRRGTSIKRFWDVLAVYEVRLFIRDDRVVRVDARVERTFP